jgi:hypothetical protein
MMLKWYLFNSSMNSIDTLDIPSQTSGAMVIVIQCALLALSAKTGLLSDIIIPISTYAKMYN